MITLDEKSLTRGKWSEDEWNTISSTKIRKRGNWLLWERPGCVIVNSEEIQLFLLPSCPTDLLKQKDRKLLAPCTIFNKSKYLLRATWFIFFYFLSSQFTEVICFCWICYKKPGVFCLSVSDRSVGFWQKAIQKIMIVNTVAVIVKLRTASTRVLRALPSSLLVEGRVTNGWVSWLKKQLKSLSNRPNRIIYDWITSTPEAWSLINTDKYILKLEKLILGYLMLFSLINVAHSSMSSQLEMN